MLSLPLFIPNCFFCRFCLPLKRILCRSLLLSTSLLSTILWCPSWNLLLSIAFEIIWLPIFGISATLVSDLAVAFSLAFMALVFGIFLL
ncbi:unnamed protein product [Moneuplotes crassus]|uniref:Uncharacterized protein n=1 Tax=Euplotes crassus TaxID=5936 RepID=A0AAD1XYQ5_EUPCR|nr:unnamed protein product [Moneuplotes crassus]